MTQRIRQADPDGENKSGAGRSRVRAACAIGRRRFLLLAGSVFALPLKASPAAGLPEAIVPPPGGIGTMAIASADEVGASRAIETKQVFMIGR